MLQKTHQKYINSVKVSPKKLLNEKVQNIPHNSRLPELRDIFKGYVDEAKIEHKFVTKNINLFKTATKRLIKYILLKVNTMKIYFRKFGLLYN